MSEKLPDKNENILKKEDNLLKKIFIAFTGILSLIYIINPSAGLLEIIPDNIPMIGNLDEATATALLIGCLRYYGMDITKLFLNKKKK